ncbi:MAG: hypothetical protein ACRD0Z_17275 [Acidimicrobiales bacterium]
MSKVRRLGWWAAGAVAAGTAVGGLVLGAGLLAMTPNSGAVPSGSSARPPSSSSQSRYTPAADVANVRRAQASARLMVTEPGMPTCKAPALPAPTYPPGHSYGVPFLAAVTGGKIVTGYDEWTANHTRWTAGGKTYHLYPWQAEVYDITGWVTGLLQLPDLSATISPQDVVFCDTGGTACESAQPPAGECIRVRLNGAPVKGQAPSPTITNQPPPGKKCYEASNHCIPYVVSLRADGGSSLTVTGVQPDGALDLSVTTGAQAGLSISFPGGSGESCQNAKTTITLSTQLPSKLPAGAPVPPVSGNPDLRSLRNLPRPLTGPLATASSIVASNDFSVPAFSEKTCPLLAAVFDAPLAGWNAKSSSDSASENNNYFDKSRPPADAGTPGWVQFSATTTVSALDLPVGPPTGFTLGSTP